MSEPLRFAYRKDVRVGLEAILPSAPEAIKACPITRQDLDILIEGSGAGHHKTRRDFMVGIFVSALTGVIGLITTVPDDIAKTPKATFIFLLLLGSAAMATLVLSVQHHYQAQTEEGRISFRNCKDRLERLLDSSPP